MMKTIKYLIITLILISLYACVTTPKIDLIAHGEVQVTTMPSETIKFTKVDVHQHGNKTEFQVVISPIKTVKRFVSGDIKIYVSEPGKDTDVINITKAEQDHLSTGRIIQHSHFYAILPYKLQPGTTIQIEHIPGNE